MSSYQEVDQFYHHQKDCQQVVTKVSFYPHLRKEDEEEARSLQSIIKQQVSRPTTAYNETIAVCTKRCLQKAKLKK